MRFRGAVLILLCWSVRAWGATASLTCDATADPLSLRSEGLAERVGSIVMNCQALSGDTVTGSLTVFLSAPVTNHLSAAGTADVSLTAITSTGPMAVGGSPLLIGSNTLVFGPVNFTMPANGLTALTISKIRVAPGANRAVTALISTNGFSSIGIRNNPVTVGVPAAGLLANLSGASILCDGSAEPEEISIFGLRLAGTTFGTIRVTEAFPTAFERKVAGADSGTRTLIRYTGFPAGARVFVPEVIAGSSATVPTSAGDFGVSASGGQYTPGTGGQLLLARVLGADANGAGGTPVYVPGGTGAGTVALNAAAEVALFNGTGFAVFEVMDANGTAIESAQIPTYASAPAPQGGPAVTATVDVSFAPLSTEAQASETAPVPRFRDVDPGPDCGTLNDCQAPYFPKLFVDSPELTYQTPPTAPPGYYSQYIRVLNDGGGRLNWTTRIVYHSGTGWLAASPASGVNNASIILSAVPQNFEPGFYTATFTIDGGPAAGSRSFPVQLEVTAGTTAPPEPPPQTAVEPPRFWEARNAADLGVEALVAGSRATLTGIGLSGSDVHVTANGLEATVVSNTDKQIMFLVPPELALLSSAEIVVTVDNAASAGLTAPLAVSAPAIFPGAVLNQDGFPNAPDNAELAGNILQIFATGLPMPNVGVITAKIHDRDIEQPLYGGPAPGSSGVQQVNLPIPGDLQAMTTEVKVCGAPAANPAQKTCSKPALVTLRR